MNEINKINAIIIKENDTQKPKTPSPNPPQSPSLSRVLQPASQLPNSAGIPSLKPFPNTSVSPGCQSIGTKTIGISSLPTLPPPPPPPLNALVLGNCLHALTNFLY